MRCRVLTTSGVAAALLFLCAAPACSPQPARDKAIWNYEGGILLRSNGSLSNGVCFRISGRVTAPGFFDNLKRVDTDHGAVFRRGSELVTQFPDRVFLAFVVLDQHDPTCPPRMENTGSPYLTRSLMSSLKLYLYWKHGVELRPISDVESKYFSVDPVIPYAAAQAHDLPEKLEWSYLYSVPSANVPLTDSLVLILRTADGHMAARVAARM